MSAPTWAEGLTVAGLYYDGIIDESKLQDTLELHKRDTVSTFGTRSSRRVSKNTEKVLGESQVVNQGQCDQPANADSTIEKENIKPHAVTVQVKSTYKSSHQRYHGTKFKYCDIIYIIPGTSYCSYCLSVPLSYYWAVILS